MAFIIGIAISAKAAYCGLHLCYLLERRDDRSAGMPELPDELRRQRAEQMMQRGHGFMLGDLVKLPSKRLAKVCGFRDGRICLRYTDGGNVDLHPQHIDFIDDLK